MNNTEHLLVCLAEEGNEIAIDAAKALRFGLRDVNVKKPNGPTNIERIIVELNDLMAVVELLVGHGVLPDNWESTRLKNEKKKRLEGFMHYARERGRLCPLGDDLNIESSYLLTTRSIERNLRNVKSVTLLLSGVGMPIEGRGDK